VRHIFIDDARILRISRHLHGHSIGKWDGDTLVVDTTGFNDKTWLDRDGHHHSDEFARVERFHRADRDNMQVESRWKRQGAREALDHAVEFPVEARLGHHGTGLHR